MTCNEQWKEHLRKGSLALAREDYPFAQTELTLALHEAKTTFDDQGRLGVIYGLLAQSFFKHANFDQAEPLLKQAIELESHDLTKSGTQAMSRDLICLAEIFRSRGCTSEALACLENAVASFSKSCQEPYLVEEISGNEEFAALKNLFASAATHKAKPAKQASSRKAIVKIETAAASQLSASRVANSKYVIDESSSQYGTTGQTARHEANSDETVAYLEQEYCQLVQLVNRLIALTTSRHSKLIPALLNLVKVGMKLGLTEQPEQFIDYAFSLAFGKNHARQLAIPNGSAVVENSLIVELMLTKADFYSHYYDYGAAAKCFADLMKWLEKHEQSSRTFSEVDSSVFITSFIYLTQKADLYASARLLIKQAIELEEYGECLKAISVYDKALVIFEQLFPHNHLEVAQVLQFKAAALASIDHEDEAADIEGQAENIEDSITASSLKTELLVDRLPPLDFIKFKS